MSFQFVPGLEITATKNIDYVVYSENSSCNVVDGILTPTTPSHNKVITTDDNSFYNSLPPPFQPFAYTNDGADNYCQETPIEFSPTNKPSSNYCSAVSDDYYSNNYVGQYSTTVINTPDSIGNQFDYNRDTFFCYDPEIIDKYNTRDLDTDYVNFNEENCNSKNQSPCSSPMDPWIVSNAMIENGDGKSPKIENTAQILPSINQAFSTHFTNLDAAPQATITSNTAAYDENNILDSFDSSLFDFGISIKSEEDANDFNSYNYNYIGFDDKPNREYKDIWEENEITIEAEQKVINKVPKAENSKDKKQKKIPKKLVKQIIIEEADDEEEAVPQQLICLWSECYQEFKTQSSLVSHIEKAHVSTAKTLKGDEYTCLWADCPRQYRSFNARYKLLIHMRVHSGEKPNKCPFPGCPKAFSRLENLKIHTRSHTGERPYTCTFLNCIKAFSNSSDRAKHQRTHFDMRPYACQLPGCTKRYTDPSSLRKHVKNHDHKGRRKSHKESTGNKLSKKTSTTIRRTYSESSVVTCATTPSTPLTPHFNTTKFDFDDVFEDDPQQNPTPESNAMNFDEMSNCLITLMDHSTINGDNSLIPSTTTEPSGCYNIVGSGYKHCDNTYDSINYVEQQSELGNLYFT